MRDMSKIEQHVRITIQMLQNELKSAEYQERSEWRKGKMSMQMYWLGEAEGYRRSIQKLEAILILEEDDERE